MSLPTLADSLAGRMELHTLWPLSQGEIADTRETFVDRLFAPKLAIPAAAPTTEDDVIDRICAGGYPEAHTRQAGRRRNAWFDAYIDAILQRDVRELAQIDRLLDMPRLLGLLASRTGQLALIRVILDNHSARVSKETRACLASVPNRFEFVFTPKHGSWLNLVESFFGKLARTLLRGIRLESKDELKERILRHLDWLNADPVAFKWGYGLDELEAA